MYETGSCGKKDKNAVFMSLFLVKFSVAHFTENMRKVVELTVVFSSIFCHSDETFCLTHFILLLGRNQTQHFIPCTKNDLYSVLLPVLMRVSTTGGAHVQ
jgi:hypothetical protein